MVDSSDLVPLEKAAERLSVSRGTMWRRAKEWNLTIYASPLDRRKKLLKWADIEQAIGGSADDTLNAAAAGVDARLDGGPGNDVLVGSPHDDLLLGSAGDDAIIAALANREKHGSGDHVDVSMADAAGITLCAIARADGFEIFTHPQRIAVEAAVEEANRVVA